MILGNCPVCDGMIEVREKSVRGKKIKLYACTNAHWETEDGELWELSEDATCDSRIWQNTLARYGKWLSYKDVRELLNEGEIEVELVSKKWGKKVVYTKKIVIDPHWGVSVVWEDM